MLQALLLAVLLSPPAAAVPPEADRKALEGLEAAYSLDFVAASAAFAAAGRLAPEHPVGPFFLAALTWLEFSLDADLLESGRVLKPRFEAHLAEALRRAEAMGASAEARFFAGAAYGMRGRWLLIERRWLTAASAGHKGYKQLKAAVRLDPGLYDAYLGLGMYDYYADRLPVLLKLAALLVAGGDKERGLRRIRLAAEKGHYSVIEAKLFLAGIYAGYEKEPERALEVVAELRRARPGNPFFAFVEMITRLDAGDWPGAAALGEELRPRLRGLPVGAQHASLFDLHLGEAYLGGADYAKALAVLDRCLAEAPEPRRASVTYCRLRRAQAFDLLGRREEARADYEAVAERPDFLDSRGKARKGLAGPATRERLLAELRE